MRISEGKRLASDADAVRAVVGIGSVLVLCLLAARPYAWYLRITQWCSGVGCARDVTELPAGGIRLPDDSWGPMWRAYEVVQTAGPEAIYDLFFTESVRFQYPPLVIFPLSFFSPEDQLQTYLLLNRLSMLLVPVIGLLAGYAFLRLVEAYAAVSTSGVPAVIRWRWPLAMATALVLAVFPPVMRGVQLGQIQVLLTAMLMLAFVAFILGHQRSSAVLLAAICACKPMLAPVLAWGIVARQRPFAVAFVLAGAALGLASLALYGWQANLRFLEVLSFLGSHAESYYQNSAPAGVVHRLLGHNPEWTPGILAPYSPLVDLTGKVTVAVFVVLGVLLASRTRINAPLSLAAAFAAFTLASPIVWEHHYSFFLPLVVALMATMAAQPGQGSAGNWLLLLLGLFLMVSRVEDLFRYSGEPGLRHLGSALPYIGGVTLLGLAWRLLPAKHETLGEASLSFGSVRTS